MSPMESATTVRIAIAGIMYLLGGAGVRQTVE
jgi:hypothetical protein